MTQSPSPFGAHTQKYWDRRHEYFSRWDAGIVTDAEGLFSVKPEKFALDVARLLQGDVVLDAFCGIGGSAIGFARCGKKVIAVDIHAERLAMARGNAEIYGVAGQIDFIHADINEVFDDLAFDALNLDPPWGGPDYARKAAFEWTDFLPNPLPLIKKALRKNVKLAVGLPVNFAPEALRELPADTVVLDSADATRLLFRTAYFPPPPPLAGTPGR